MGSARYREIEGFAQFGSMAEKDGQGKSAGKANNRCHPQPAAWQPSSWLKDEIGVLQSHVILKMKTKIWSKQLSIAVWHSWAKFSTFLGLLMLAEVARKSSKWRRTTVAVESPTGGATPGAVCCS